MTTTKVDAWVFPVVPDAARDPAFVALLGPDDARRVSQLGRSADRDRSVCARVAARTELGRRLGVAADRVPLVGGGRPSIADTDATVSWSHSGQWIALAIARGLPVGIDIEKTPDRLDLGALAELRVASLEDFVGLEAASKATACLYEGAWPPDVTVRRLAAPQHYVAAVAAPGDEWGVELHMRSPLEHCRNTVGTFGSEP